jgi:acyl-CoA synthetase (AMP-forming)/AMP-acid ligase II
MDTIDLLLSEKAISNGAKIAFKGRDHNFFTYADLAEKALQFAQMLRDRGVVKEDRVAIIMRQGTNAGVAFLAVASYCIAAPLNPAATRSDLLSWLTDLSPVCVIVDSDADDSIVLTARELKIPTIPFDVFFDAPQHNYPQPLLPTQPGDTALILHTSGTTAKAKMVPLTHANLMASARNVTEVLRLDIDDTCLCIMPFFHIHGIVGSLLATLLRGGTILVPEAFEPEIFFRILHEHRPTWYSAVPTLHQRILSYLDTVPEAALGHVLRLIHSSSAALSPATFARLEEKFGVPVIEAYGMTEAAHQMCSNPLPPGIRKPGSVGLPSGPEIGVVDGAGKFLSPDNEGEIVIRGNNVTSGYLHLPEELQGRLPGGWFRTGDMGRFDPDGYLYISGRLKEIINRGGEKVSPLEVDEALLRHASVAEAVCFGVPHPTLGEDLMAAVVLKTGIEPSRQPLREYLLDTLTPFKVPTRVLILEKIPKSSVGEVQRLKIYDLLKDSIQIRFEEPLTGTEQLVASVFRDAIGPEVGPVGSHDNFFSMGGDSLQATGAAEKLRQSLGILVEPSTIFRYPTAEALGEHLDTRLKEEEIAKILSGLDGMSEEEVRILMETIARDGQQ